MKENTSLAQIKIGTSIHSSGLGDVLLLTALCRHMNCIVELHPIVERFGCLFDGIADVVLTEDNVVTPDVGFGHFATRKLRHFGLENKSNLPRILITEEEADEAKSTLDTIVGDDARIPIVLVTNCSGAWKSIREINDDFWRSVVDRYQDTHVFLHFGIDTTFSSLNMGISELKNQNIRKQAALFKVIGRYVGVNTGDFHLMTAVGGKCFVIVPDESHQYRNSEWVYDDPQIRSIPFSRCNEIINGGCLL